MNLVWRNGEFIDRSAAALALESAAVSYAHAVFDACRVVVSPRQSGLGYVARIFSVETHIDRFLHSCFGLKLTVPTSAVTLKQAACGVIQRNAPAETCGLRWFALNEATSFGSVEPATILIFLRSLNEYSQSRPYRLALDHIPRPTRTHLRPTVKAMAHYSTARIAFLHAKQSGFDDVVFINESNRITETSRASLLLLSGMDIFVPPVDEGLLQGITQQLIQRVCAKVGEWNWIEQPIAVSELASFDAALICSSSVGIVRVSQIGPVVFQRLNRVDELIRIFDDATKGHNNFLSDCVEELSISDGTDPDN